MHNRRGGNPSEKAKDFKGSIKRQLHELRNYKVLIIISLVLAALGSILSITAPDRLKDLTNEISKGLIPNTENITSITEKITSNLIEEELSKKMIDILDIKIDEKTIAKIMMDSSIKPSDKETLEKALQTKDLKTIPENILNIILTDSTYKGELITKKDKIKLISINKDNFTEIPDSIKKIILDTIEIDEIKISSSDQIEFLSIMSNVDKENTNDLFNKLDTLPDSIKTLIKPSMDMKSIKNITLFLIILYICSATFTYIEQISMTIVSNEFAKKLRGEISKKINKLPLKYFDNHQTGDILSRVTNDVDTVSQSMNQSLATLVSSLTLFIGTMIMMFVTNPLMAITAIVSSLIGFIFMFIILGKSQKYFVERQEELGNLNGHIEEVYSGLNVVKAYNGKYESDKKFDEYNKKVYDANRKSQFLSGLMMPMMGFIGHFGYVAVCIVGALLTMNNKISFGVIVAFISYVRLFTSPLSQIGQAMTSIQASAAASERVFEFLDEKEMEKETNAKKLNKNNVKGEIEFDNVTFKYDGNDEPTIKNFTAKAKPGQKIAIVGPTGAGKTTMVNLLMKFYEINEGNIKIDGISTKNLTRENIHSLFTMVLQDTWLFSGTIRENIVYNRKNITNKKLDEVCSTVGLDHFIKTLPQGYDTDITDNDSVSAGQRQLLTIARGMIEDAPFLILDEATSNVDTRTEELVQIAMDKLMQGRTSFIIAHRLSTIKNADLILVMKDGNIIETGNHNELMKKNGFYAELYNSQFEL